jgi:hypothetical protein
MASLKDKLIQANQRTALKGLMAKVGNAVRISNVLLHPLANIIVTSMQTFLKSGFNTTLQENEIKFAVTDFLTATNTATAYQCILPCLSVTGNNVVTKFPLVETDCIGVQLLFEFFLEAKEIDFFAIVAVAKPEFHLVISSYSDFPSEENDYYDGPVYEFAVNSPTSA